ncbi:MAG: dTDP-4-dehydrorhamnose 3,5-epimerase [Gemmatimonadetes bacterium]|nr:dTDP-4-dehydrorhamnose 3,5-epimerase [Gemmatimonadota bacterium]
MADDPALVMRTPLDGVLLITPASYRDERGLVLERYRFERYQHAGIMRPFVQDNVTQSMRGVVRGLHFQIGAPQDKLVDVSRGAIWDVAVDLRPGSPSFGEWFGADLSEDNRTQMFIPAGFAHGYAVTSAIADVHYKFTEYHRPEAAHGVAWDDPAIGITWPKLGPPILSARDRAHPRLFELTDALLSSFRFQ